MEKEGGYHVVSHPSEAQEPVYASLPISEVFDKDLRLEANFYNIEGRKAQQLIQDLALPKKSLCGEDGLSTATYPNRFKRIYVDEPGLEFYQPSQINELFPTYASYVGQKTKTNFNNLKVKLGQILLTRSGTVGNIAFVSKTLEGKIFSDDLIRIEFPNQDLARYVYAFLKSPIGKALIQTNHYGAVVNHIEPEHIEKIMVPVANQGLIKAISQAVTKSFELRDMASHLLAEAHNVFSLKLNLPNILELKKTLFESPLEKPFAIPASSIQDRLEASFYNPVCAEIIKRIEQESELLSFSSEQLVKKIYIPGRFKRVYVDKGQGITFFSGKSIGELNPNDKKYLSLSQHADRIKNQLTIKEGMLLVTCSGTVGEVASVIRPWDGWAMTHDIIRVIPQSAAIGGYLYSWLTSPYGRELLKRFSYGAVVPHIEDHHLELVEVPMLDKTSFETISSSSLRAFEYLSQAFDLEQEAITRVEAEVLGIASLSTT